MELKIKQLEKQIKLQDSKINALNETHEQFFLALNLLQQMCESDAIIIKNLIKRIDSLYTPTTFHNINDKLSIL